ncbi:MAG: PHB depolymerase family esterase [Candidatus Sungbacteria bacterium]|nr:PHB depolymerase family esterase [bacterium]MDZ4260476.1 PHB depolymerase family esterase [Candidatus Sungbacteria bacterium]
MKKMTIVLLLVIMLIVGFAAVRRIKHRRFLRQTPSAYVSFSPLPSPGTAYKSGNYQESITVDGRTRTYIFRVPTTYSPEKIYPLVLVFHGGAGEGIKIASQTDFPEKADKEDFIAVFPDGIEHSWNDGRDATKAYKQGADDVAFVRLLITNLTEKLSVDQKRIYATGVSNGAIFSHRLGCEMADVFAAIAPDVGSLAANLESRCIPLLPISIVVIQGTEDPFININGGEVKNKYYPRLGDGGVILSAEKAMRFWAEKNGCEGEPTVTHIPPTVNDGTRVIKKQFNQCRNNTEVTYYIVEGMGHTWPPHEPQVPAVSGASTKNINATDVFWEFFKAHSKP